jgi:hypothetical protein
MAALNLSAELLDVGNVADANDITSRSVTKR